MICTGAQGEMFRLGMNRIQIGKSDTNGQKVARLEMKWSQIATCETSADRKWSKWYIMRGRLGLITVKFPLFKAVDTSLFYELKGWFPERQCLFKWSHS